MLFDLILSKIVCYAVAGHYHVQSETIFKLYEKNMKKEKQRQMIPWRHIKLPGGVLPNMGYICMCGPKG